MGAGLSATFPLIVAAAARTEGLEEAPAIAAVSGLGYVGLMAGPATIGALSDARRAAVGAGAGGGLCLVAAVLAGQLDGRRAAWPRARIARHARQALRDPGIAPGQGGPADARPQGNRWDQVDVPTVLCRPFLRARGFPGPTVPAMVLDGRKVQTTRAISRALDEIRPDPPLFPADPAAARRGGGC